MRGTPLAAHYEVPGREIGPAQVPGRMALHAAPDAEQQSVRERVR